MSVEVAIQEPLIGVASGFSAAAHCHCARGRQGTERGAATVFVYDGASSTVNKRKVTVGGVRDNRLIVTEGVGAGDIVAVGRRLLFA